MQIMGPSALGAMGLIPAMPVRAGLAGGSRLLPNWLDDCCCTGTAAMGWYWGDGAELGMTSAGGDCGLENDGDPVVDPGRTTGGEGANGLGERAESGKTDEPAEGWSPPMNGEAARE